MSRPTVIVNGIPVFASPLEGDMGVISEALRELALRAEPDFVLGVDPTADDDSANTAGHGEARRFSTWLNSAELKLFICLSAAKEAAVWQEVGAGGGGLAAIEEDDAPALGGNLVLGDYGIVQEEALEPIEFANTGAEAAQRLYFLKDEITSPDGSDIDLLTIPVEEMGCWEVSATLIMQDGNSETVIKSYRRLIGLVARNQAAQAELIGVTNTLVSGDDVEAGIKAVDYGLVVYWAPPSDPGKFYSLKAHVVIRHITPAGGEDLVGT